MVREIMVLATLIALHACADPSPTPLLDLTQIAGRSESEVARLLGDPTGTETVYAGDRGDLPKKLYRDGAIDIVFVEGRADWIGISFAGCELPFSRDILAHLGLPDTRPTFSNPAAVIRWENIPGLREVNVFPGPDENASHAYILVSTEP